MLYKCCFFLFSQKQYLQNNAGHAVKSISNILENVNRQMLLIFKTNDLIRGIETTLQTQNRMTAFWAMSKCCVKSAYHELKTAKYSKVQYLYLDLQERWEIFKLNIFYVILGLWNFGLIDAIQQII